jgi:proteasome lid subunit RPN8/RPN11
MKKISIPIKLWLKLIYGLRKRGRGEIESGGFLLSNLNSCKVSKIVFYDQFDESVSDSGIIQFKGAVKFYEFLAKEGLEVLADIHTHPTNNTNQSDSDRKHPMIKVKGHIAIIAPNFAKNLFTLPRECSIYEYLGGYNWKSIKQSNILIQLKLF